jgi:hypothetical protein
LILTGLTLLHQYAQDLQPALLRFPITIFNGHELPDPVFLGLLEVAGGDTL